MRSTFDSACRALTQGLRQTLRRPLSAFVSALCLGVGIAACAASWSLTDAAILRPFGLQRANELVVLWETDPARGRDLIEISHLNFLDWQREARTLSSMAAFGSSHWPALARIGDDTVPLAARAVSSSFFATLGVRPALGRDVETADLQGRAPPPVMLSHRLWLERFAGAPSIVGRSLFIDGTDHQIVGVMPSGFGYPDDPDVWLSLERALADAFKTTPPEARRQIGILEAVGRRRAEAANADVGNELTVIARALRRRYHEPDDTVAVAVTPYADSVFGRLGARLWIALALAAVVLIFALANVTAVRLAQLRERAAELSARLFLGASRRRLTIELAFEAVPLVALAFAISWFARASFVAMLSRSTVIAESGATLPLDGLGVAVVLLLLAAVALAVVGPLTAWVAARRVSTLAHPPGTRVSRRVSIVGSPLVLGQAAIAIAAVAIAGAALQAFARLSRTDVGFSQAGVTLVDVGLPGWKYDSAAGARQLFERLLVALRELPGVDRAAAVSLRPFRFGEIADGLPVRRTGDALIRPDDATTASRVVVTRDYFAAMGQPILEGRAFTAQDTREGEAVAVISRALARSLWGDAPAAGRRLDTYTLSEQWRTRVVVGVVGDARYRGLERPSTELYVPDTQATTPLSSLVLANRAGLDAATIRQALKRVEPELAIERIQSTRDVVQTALSPSRLLTTVTGMLGATGLVLLALGTFGAASAALRAARSEIAIRQALGARPAQAVGAPLVMLTRAFVTGILVGLAATPLALSSVEGLGLSADAGLALPLAMGAGSVMLAAAIACAPSLIQAARVAPAELLRTD
jgi:putative ABC transport system permease protein